MSTTKKGLQSLLSEIFMRDAYCSSSEEAATIAQLVVESEVEDGVEDKLSEMLEDCLGITAQEAVLVQKEAMARLLRGGDGDDQSDTEEEANNEGIEEADHGKSLEDYENDDDDMIIGDGECVLCERYIQVTKHHLIPKSTWSRLEKSLRNAIIAGNTKKHPPSSHFLGSEDNDFLIEGITDVKQVRRSLLNRTCEVCRPCHSAIHRTHDNMTLAINYNTVDRLLADETIQKFCKWANKQRPGKYARKDDKYK